MKRLPLSRLLSFAFATIALQSAHAAITGNVFQDFNSNGVRDTATTIPNANGVGAVGAAVDRALANVQVRAFCVTSLGADGVLGTADDTITAFPAGGPVVTDASGNYSVTTAGVVAATAPQAACRVEFSWDATSPFIAPANVLPNPLFGMRPTFVGTGSNTATQFVNDGATANLGLNYPADFCQNNPTLVVNCLRYGDAQTGPANTSTALHGLPYSARTNNGTGTSSPSPTTQLARVNQIGATWGIAYHKPTDKILVSSYFKRHIGVGPGGLGQIYVANSSGSVVNNFLNLETLKPGSAGVDPRLAGNDYDRDAAVLVGGDLKVGKLGIGDIEISDDQKTLYAIGLNSRRLYVMPVGVGLTAPAAAAITEVTLPDPGTGATGCPADAATPAGELNRNLRPFALKYSRGSLYVGMTCTAESTGAAAALRAFVYRYDGTTFTQIVNTSLNYNLAGGLAWNAWTDLADSGFSGCCFQRPEPLLTDIEFSASGDMLLGVRDRTGDTTGRGNLPLTGTGTVDGRQHGDLIRACVAPATGLYSPASCTPNGVGWFADSGVGGGLLPDPNGSMGGLAQVPGFPDVVQTVKDPTRIYTNGIFWHNTSTGGATKGYEILDPNTTAGAIFVNGGKAAGLGDIEALCGTAPLEVGNRVWNDANGNGIQDPGEPAIAGVTVRLYAPDGVTVLATAVTDANGQYAFSNRTVNENGTAITFPGATTPTTGTVNAIPGFTADTTGYSIRMDNPANYAAGGPLASFKLTGTNAGGVATNDPLTDLTDSDAVLPTPTAPIGTGNYPRINFNTGGPGENNFGLDAGFSRVYSLGNRVWFDTNNNGLLDGAEVGIIGVRVELQNASGQKLYRTPTGAVTTTAAGNTAIEVVTDAAGYYRFDDLPGGDYIVSIPGSNWTGTGALAGYQSSTVTEADPDSDVDSNDNGLQPATAAAYTTAGVQSGVVTLGPASSEPTNDTDRPASYGAGSTTGTEAADNQSNLSVDFGFYRLTAGNLIWRDDGTGGGTANNGTRDGTEPGISGVTVELLDSGGNVVAVTTTDANGNYSFTRQTAGGTSTGTAGAPLLPGNYTVRVPGGQAALNGLISSADPGGGATPLTADNDDNGTGTNLATGATSTQPFALTAGTNAATGATGTNPNGTTDQPRVDLGFAPTFSLGNRLFLDPNNNGRQDATENGIAGATVVLRDSAGAQLYRTPAGAVTTVAAGNTAINATTDASGYYRFDNLPASATGYIVGVVASTLPTGVTSSTGTQTGDQGDKGADAQVAGEYRSAAVPVGPGLQPTGETDITASGAGAQGPSGDANTNSTIDFGFVPPPTFSLGNRVWFDTNNNGLLDGGEVGTAGVRVELLNSTGQKLYRTPGGTLSTTAAGNTAIEVTTDGGGYYRFDDLPAGDYIVSLPGSNWASGAPLAGYQSSGTTEADPNLNVDSNDNGAQPVTAAAYTAAGVRSAAVTLGPTANEPTNDTDRPASYGAGSTTGTEAADNQSNLSVDFGFYRLTAGNLIWRDDGTGGGTANNGTRDGTEPGISGVTVELLDNGSNVVAVTTTDANGNYSFTQQTAGGTSTGTAGAPLLPGNYTVRVPGGQAALVGLSSTTDPAGAATPLSADNDDNGTGTNAATGATTTTSFALAAGTNAATGAVGTNANGTTDQPRVDLGFVSPPTFSLGNRVFLDPNNDGRQGAGENGIAGATVVLRDSTGAQLYRTPAGAVTTVAAGNTAISATTDASGYYRFDNLPASATGYIVGVVASTLPTGVTSSTGTQTGDQGDKGADAQVAGEYRSAAVPVGTGLQPTGETDITASGAGAQGPSGDANTNSTIDFGFVPPTYSIGNRVWRDVNNDGQRAASGEPGIDLVAMTVYAADASGNPTGAPIATTTTANGGYYRFDNLAAGDYVVVVDPSNFAAGGALASSRSSTTTQANPNTDIDNDDNGIDATNPASTGVRSGRITLGPGTTEPTGETDLVTGANPQGPVPDNQANMTVDFGFYPLASLGDKVFLDTNANGIQDAGEAGVPGVTVRLLDGSGNPVIDPATGNPITTTTDGNGNYLFTNLPVGSYQVEFVPPAGYSISPKDQGGNDATDSDIDPTTRRTPVVTLAAGENNPTLDAGLFFTAGLGDRVWHDLNKNGVQDAGEPGVAGVTATLINSSTGATVATTTTDGSGNYSFSGLTPGVPYVVAFSNLPTGYQFTVKGPGASTSDAPDSDADPATGRTDPITLTSGQNDPNWDAGIYGPIDLLLDKSAAPVAPATGSPYLTGDQIEFTLTVTNGGPATALSGYTVIDLVPAGLGSPTVTSSTGFSPCAFAGQTLTCVGTNNLAAGAANAVTIKYRATITASSGSVKNIAYVDKAASDPSAETNPLGTPPTAATNASASPTNNDADVTIVVNATTYSLGNRVWIDTNNNGALDAGEVGKDGVTVELINAATGTVISSTTTANGGYYRFDSLPAGDYIVQIAASNFTGTGALAGHTSSGPTEATPNSDVDSNDNGLNAPVGGAIRSGTVTLGPGASEPTGETDVASPNPAGEAPDARSNLTVDFGLVPPASLGDRVFRDTNGNGIQDAGEAGVPGVTVTLYDGAGNPVPGVAPQVTDASGNYLFTNLPPGTYTVGFSNLPAGTTLTTANQGADDAADSDADPATGRTGPITLAAGETNRTVDAGIVTTAGVTVGNFVWRDNNGNGIQDAGEPGVPGVTATISRVGGGAVTDVNGNPVTTTATTDANGIYQFANLAPGQYTITFSNLPAGFTPTTTNAPGSTPANDSNGLTATSSVLTAGQSDLTLDLGLIPPASGTFSIGNRVFSDPNNNGRQDAGEAGLANVQVRLLDASGNPVAGVPTQTTDANGYYRFDNLPAGTYIVEVVGSTLPTGVTSSTGTQTGDQGDKGADAPVGGNYRSAPVQVGPGLQPTGETDLTTSGPGAQGPGGDANTNSTIDFGFVLPSGTTATVTGNVFFDGNRDTTKGAGEGGVPPGTTVQLVNPTTGAVIATTTTDASGNYTFANVPPGNYNVVVPTAPTGTTQTTRTTVPVTATAGAATAAPNIGFGPANGTATITGTVFSDGDRSGTKAPTEGGVPPGTTVQLLDSNGNVVATTTTDANGNYTFVNVPAGNYTVVIPTPPTGTSATTPTRVPVVASANSTAVAPIVGFGPGAATNASITGTVFNDPNRNGTRDPSETGVSTPLTVELVNSSGIVIATTTTDASGTYTFPNVPAGTYSVRISVPPGSTATTPTTVSLTVPTTGTATAPAVGIAASTAVTQIPTLSEWGMIIMSLILALFGFAGMRRRG